MAPPKSCISHEISWIKRWTSNRNDLLVVLNINGVMTILDSLLRHHAEPAMVSNSGMAIMAFALYTAES